MFLGNALLLCEAHCRESARKERESSCVSETNSPVSVTAFQVAGGRGDFTLAVSGHLPQLRGRGFGKVAVEEGSVGVERQEWKHKWASVLVR